MPTDIFPNINIPVVSVVFNFGGLSPAEVAGRIVTPFERTMTTSVDDIEHVESQSLAGIGMVKIFFQPTADIRLAASQIAAVAPQTTIRNMPAGTQPPIDHRLQRRQCCRAAGGLFQHGAVGVRNSGPGAEFRAPASGVGARHVDRRCLLAARTARSVSTWIPNAMQARGLSAGDVQTAAHQPEPDHARRHRQDRHLPVSRPAQRRDRHDRSR